MRKFLTGLIKIACSKIFKYELPLIKTLTKENLQTSVIMNFMNLCMNTIADFRTEFYDGTEFFKLFYIFSQISKDLAIYMIQNDLNVRLLKYFFSTLQTNRDFHKIVLKPLGIHVPEEGLLGKPNEVQKKKMTKIEELKQKKKEKYWLENNFTNRLYLWKTLGYLIRFYRVHRNVERNPLQISALDIEISNLELGLYLDLENLINILCDCDRKISVKSVSELYAYLCYENLKYTELVLKALLKEIKEKEAKYFRPYYGVLKKILKIKDSVSEARVCEVKNPNL